MDSAENRYKGLTVEELIRAPVRSKSKPKSPVTTGQTKEQPRGTGAAIREQGME